METYSYNGETHELKERGKDYEIVYERTCISCGHKWTGTFKPVNTQCPKCHSYKLYYVTKRSCDPVIEESEIITPPEESLLM